MEQVIHESGPAMVEHHHDSHWHTHGVVDRNLMTTGLGLRAVKWSFAVLAAGATLQVAVVMMSGSIALLADAIHNAADAATAIPLGIAFVLMRRKATDRFTFGYGRVEDLAGLVVVLVILMSAIAAGYEAVSRLFHPHPVAALGAVAAAGLIGFIANEVAAFMRIRTGREIHSAALVADGEHARIDGLTSLAVAAGAGAVKLGYPIADPIIALAISIAIFGIVRESAMTVFTRLLDGVEPGLVAEIRRRGQRIPGIRDVFHVRARWVGHRLHAEADIAVDPVLSVSEGIEIADHFKAEVMHHVPGIHAMHVGIRAPEGKAA